jgi:hypothetical protein
MVMVVEMTGSFGLIVPLMLVVVTAYGVGRRFGLVTEQLASPADSPTHAGDLLVSLLERVRVTDAARSVWPAVVERATPLARIVAALPSGQPPTAIVVEQGRVIGVISALLLAYAAGRNAAGRIHAEGEFGDVGATVNAWLGGKSPGKRLPGRPIEL